MVTLRTWLRRALAALMMGAPAGRLHAAQPQVTATLSPESVPAGEGASLVLRVQGGEVENPQLPKVPDLIFNGPQTTGSSFNFNGAKSNNLQMVYAVGSMKAGEYTIPPITVRVDGQEFKTQTFTLKVTPSANQAPEGFTNDPGGGNASADGWLKVKLALPGDRKHVWVGEIAPVRIQAWLPQARRIQLGGSLQPESSAFTLHNVSPRPQESTESAHGQPWHVVTWYAGLSAAKAGNWLPDISLKTTQLVPDPNALRRNGVVFGQNIQKAIPLSSKQGDGQPIEVRALPREGRPKNFGGAVGQFTLQGANFPHEWKTGEPQSVSAVITGKGNFNLLSQPELRPDTNWKSYEGKPEFQAGDRAAFSGTQTWKFNAAAKKSGTQPLSLTFSYFDPETARYETAESAEQQVTVTGADLPAEDEPKAAGHAPDNRGPADLLAAMHSGDTAAAQSLTPLAFRPVFRTILGTGGGLTLAGVLAGIWRMRRRDHLRKAREASEKAVRAALHEAEAFAARGDVTGFFTAARRALQTKFAALWARPPQAITLTDVAARVPGDSPAVEIFREADRVEYGRDDSVDLNPWRARLHSAMNSLTA